MATSKPNPGAAAPLVFVSHSSRDAMLARQIVSSLETNGIACWIAPRDIRPGSDYNAQIAAGLRTCTALLLLESRHSIASEQVIREVDAAANRRIPVIPVRMEATVRSEAMEHLLRTYQWIDALPPPLDRHLDTIVAGVQRALNRAVTAAVSDASSLPKYIGPYRVLDLLGEGGMGSVFRAEQRSPIRRIVALKRIKPGMDTHDVLARFESERQALARMDHPHIAKVLDAGADELGRPYFVMEFVPGKPITEFADENRLSIERRLQLFAQVCQAIAHAHTKAIIHRDVKAGNVLAYTADGRPVSKVIDFGIAKALTADRLTDRSYATAHGSAVGTYEYMSPEQAEGSPDIDTRTDVYSLGVLLYELLSGAKPFDAETLQQAADAEIRRIIREVEPPRPSTRLSSQPDAAKAAAARSIRIEALTSQLKSELEWIPLKAMRKERERRYASPLEMVEDIQNYLDNRPLKAGPESLAYRLRKTVRRNRLPLVAALLAVAALGTGTAFYVRSIRAEQQRTEAALDLFLEEQRRKDDALADAKAQSALAAQRLDEKRQALDQMLSAFSDHQLKGLSGSQPVRRLFLERGLEQYQALLSDRSSDADVLVHTIDTLRELSTVHQEIGDRDAQFACLDSAVGMARTAVASDPGNIRFRAALGETLCDLAQAHFGHGEDAEMAPLAQEGVAVMETLLGEHPSEPAFQAGLGRLLIVYAVRDRQSVDEQAAERSVALLRQAVAAHPENAIWLSELGRAINNCAWAALASADPKRQEAFSEALDYQNRAIRLQPTLTAAHVRRSRFVRNLTETLRSQGKYDEAKALLDSTIADSRRFMADNPAVAEAPLTLSELLDELAVVQFLLNRPDDALKTYEEIIQLNDALAQREPHHDKYPINSVDASLSIADIHSTWNRIPDAIQALESVASRSVARMSTRARSDPLLSRLLRVHYMLAELQRMSHRHEVAHKTLQAALELFDQYGGEGKVAEDDSINNFLECCEALVSIAELQKDSGRIIETIEKRVLPLQHHSLSANVQELRLLQLAKLAALYSEDGQPEKALPLYRSIVEEGSTLVNGDPSTRWRTHVCVLRSHASIAALCRELGDNRGSFQALRRHFAEAEPYIWDRKHDELLADNSKFSPESLERLWQAWESLSGERETRYCRLQMTAGGVTRKLDVEIAESWQFFQDQVASTEKRTGFAASPVEIAWLRRIYDFARENRLPFQLVIAYAQDAQGDLQSADAFEQVAKQKAVVQADPRNTEFRLKLAEDLLALARSMEQNESASRAQLFVEDAAAEVARCAELGSQDDERLRAIRGGIELVRGRLLLRQGEPQRAYSHLISALEIGHAEPGSAESVGEAYVELGRTMQRLNYIYEASQWYTKAAEAGTPQGLYELSATIAENSGVTRTLPRPLQDRLAEEGPKSLLRVWHQYSTAVQEGVKRAGQEAAATRSQTPEPQGEMGRALAKLFENDMTVLLLTGNNVFGDRIYCFLKLPFGRLADLRAAIDGTETFSIVDFGEVIAAGRGEAPPGLRQEIFRLYPRMSTATLPAKPAPDSLVMGPWERLMSADPRTLRTLLELRVEAFAQQQNLAEVSRCADKLKELGEIWYAARAYTRASEIVAVSNPTPSADPDLQRRCQDAAIECLKQLLAEGETSRDQIAGDEKLASLRELPQFKQLVGAE